MGGTVRTMTLGALLLLGACGGAEGPEAAPPVAPDLVHPLLTAASSPWRQQVWFVARPGEAVESLALDDAGRPVVMLVSPDGARRAVALEGPGRPAEAQYAARPGARTTLTDATADDALRVAVAHDEAVTVTVTDTRGGGRRVLVRDVADRRLAHPSIDPHKVAIYVGEVGELGGVFRVELATGVVQRIVPEPSAATPVAWRDADGERVLYVEDGDPAKVLVAWPPSGLPPRSAVEVLREGRLPASLLRAATTADGELLRLVGCEEEAPMAWRPPHDDVLRLEAAEGVGFGRAVFCGRGCTDLLTGSPAGATRLAARFEHHGEQDAWEVWFAPDLPVEGGTMVTPERAPGVLQVPACLAPLDDHLWLVKPVFRGWPQLDLTHLAGVGDVLHAWGTDRGRPYGVTITPRRAPLPHAVLNRREPPGAEAVTADGAAKATVADGGVSWVEAATGAVSELLPPDPSRKLADPAFDPSGSALYVVDHGEAPGLLRLALRQGVMTRVLAAEGLRRPYPFTWEDASQVGMVRVTPAGPEVLLARPFTAEARRAWNEGPVTLVDFTPSWTPVQVEDGRMVRCEAPDRVELGVDAEGGFLRWGELRVPARAATFDGRRLEVLGEREGTPVVLAELILAGGTARWWARALEVKPGASSWAPTPDAAALPQGGRCDPRRE